MKASFGPAVIAVGDGTARHGYLHVEEGRVSALDDRAGSPNHAVPTDCTITPGLIDLHVNGTGSYWFNREPAETLSAMTSEALKHGVTAFLPTIMTAPWELMLHAASVVCGRLHLPSSGARALGVHFEGPFLSVEYRRVHPRDCLLTPTPARIEALLNAWTAGRCRVTMAPEIEEAPRAAAELRRHSVTLAAGHTGASYAIGNAAIDAGYQILTHAFNAMPPIHHRTSSILTAYLLDPAAFCEVIADGVHVSPEHLALLYRLKGVNLILSTDYMPLVNGLVEDGGVARTRDGVIAGSRLSLHQGVRNLIAATGISLAEAVECATWAPARAIGVEDEIGTLVPGMRADFVVWNRRHEIVQVFVGGERVYVNN
ncbi:MAG TPA: amidohydrolase family protein [Candidatus Eremiobacteraceae bacterium]|nr:amidohydrolase family protein [Candidatus Eremiobacteraceae bacterium]